MLVYLVICDSESVSLELFLLSWSPSQRGLKSVSHHKGDMNFNRSHVATAQALATIDTFNFVNLEDDIIVVNFRL